MKVVTMLGFAFGLAVLASRPPLAADDKDQPQGSPLGDFGQNIQRESAEIGFRRRRPD